MRMLHLATRTSITIGSILIAFVMIVVVVNVGSRMLRMPIPAIIEIGQYGTAAVISLILARTQFDKRHISMDMFTSRLKPRPQAIMKTIATFIALIPMAAISIGVFLVTIDSFEGHEHSLVLGVPIPYFRTLFGLGMLLVFIVAVWQLIRGVAGLRRGGQ